MSRDYYIRRERSALGRGLLFRERRRRGTHTLLALVILALIGMAVVFWQLNAIQPVVLAAFGIAQTPTPTIIEAARQGDLAFWRGNLNAAIAHYTHAARLAPTNLDIVYELARMHIYRSFDDERNWADREAALAYANQLVEAHPRNGRAFSIQCYALVRLARSEEAAQTCNRAIALTPEDPNPHAYLALAYFDLARYDVAFEAAQRASSSIPTIWRAIPLTPFCWLPRAVPIKPSITSSAPPPITRAWSSPTSIWRRRRSLPGCSAAIRRSICWRSTLTIPCWA